MVDAAYIAASDNDADGCLQGLAAVMQGALSFSNVAPTAHGSLVHPNADPRICFSALACAAMVWKHWSEIRV